MKPLATYNTITRMLKVPFADVHSLFRVGSHVYGCATPASDEDFVCVLYRGKPDLIRRPKINVTIYTIETYRELLDGNSVYAAECAFRPSSAGLMAPSRLREPGQIPFTLDRALLARRAIETSTSDFDKAEKLILEDQSYSIRARKKLYHSIRVLMFGKQILSDGRITDFGAANETWRGLAEGALNLGVCRFTRDGLIGDVERLVKENR